MKKDKIIAIVGDSGCGKDTLVKVLKDELGIGQLVSYTTRDKREGETNEHIFIDNATLQKMSSNDNDPFFAFTTYGGMAYFTTESQVLGQGIQSYTIDEAGIYFLKSKIKEPKFKHLDIVFVKIIADKDIRLKRGVTEERMQRDAGRMKFSEYDIIIENNGTIEELTENILKHKKQLTNGK